jgi:hypothetical protein
MDWALTERDKELLLAWIRAWPASGHPNDWDRWFEFVSNHSRESRNVLNEAEVREFLHTDETRERGSVSDDFAEIIDHHISVAVKILDFLEHTGR